MVVDLRPLNKITEKTGMQLRNLESELNKVRRTKIYRCFDLLNGFDYMPTAPESQKYLNLMTPWGSVQGWLNTPMIFHQAITREVLKPAGLLEADKKSTAIQWIDDTLLAAEDFEAYASALDRFLEAIEKKSLRLSARKCKFCSHEEEYCGRLIKERKWRYKTSYYTAIIKMNKPKYQHEPAEAVYLAQWLGNTIPEMSIYKEFFSHMVPLGMNMKLLKRQNLLVEWTTDREKKMKGIQED
eukprot:maker-scaffold_3-snap-gene-10.55-mRNA-1 protein AED:0.14 eAED:0.14 QI:0/0/0/1/1/1/2/0/240